MQTNLKVDQVLPRQGGTCVPDYQVLALKDQSDIVALEEDWARLDQENSSVGFFQSWVWSHNFLEYAKAIDGFDPLVLTARHHGKLVAMLPLAIQSKTGRKILTGLTEPFQQYTEMLMAEGHDPGKIFSQWLLLIRQCGADVIHLGQIRHDSNLFQAMDGNIPPSGEMDAAPYVDLSQWSDFSSYYYTVKSKTRKNIRNAHNRLGTTAPVSHEVYTHGVQLGNVIDKTFAWRQDWLKRSGLTSRAFSDDDFSRFVSRISSGEGAKCCGLETIAMSLMHGDNPIAEQWGFVHKDRYYAFISGWNPEYENISPGKLHLGQVVKACFERNLKAADFMIPSVPYKLTWAKETVPVQDHVLALSFRGTLYTKLWLELARPTAKKILYKIPIPIRNKIFKVISRG